MFGITTRAIAAFAMSPSSPASTTTASPASAIQIPSNPYYLLGAIVGDIAGSRFERSPLEDPHEDFELIHEDCTFTDDTVLTIAVADAILQNKPYGERIRCWAKKYPTAGYGKKFDAWVRSNDTCTAYNSFGNGSAMRVSPCGFAAATYEQALDLARQSAICTHNHPHGINGAQATAACIWLAKNSNSNNKHQIKKLVAETFGYNLDRTISEIRPNYAFDVTCQGSVPEAILCFLESSTYEEAIRLAISLGGDSDTQAAIAGSMAHAYYHSNNNSNNNCTMMDPSLVARARAKLPDEMLAVIDLFDQHCLQLQQRQRQL